MSIIGKEIKEWKNIDVESNHTEFKKIINDLNKNKNNIFRAGGEISVEKQHKKGRLTARERIDYLRDNQSDMLEIGTFAGYEMYEEYGSPPAAGVIASIVKISGLDCMVIANDATVKAGAYFEISLKKTIRAQKIALENNLPVIYLVDSAGVFLPLQIKFFLMKDILVEYFIIMRNYLVLEFRKLLLLWDLALQAEPICL